MNSESSAARGIGIVLFGAAYSGLWLLGSAQWAGQVEASFLFPILRRLSGTEGPWVALVGDMLFATLTATAAVLLVAGLFKPWARSRAALFLIGFYGAQVAIAGHVGSTVPEVPMTRNVVLFLAWFAIFAALRTRP